MKLDIIRCENGWMVRVDYVNRAEFKAWVFPSLTDLAEWIIARPELTENVVP